MLTVTIFLPLLFAAIVLALPSRNAAAIRWTALIGACVTLAAALTLVAGFDDANAGLQWRMTTAWIPPINASYDVAVTGISLPLIVLAALMLALAMLYVLRDHDRAKGHACLFLLMATGLMGVFASQDLLLFYLFFEIALVPLYFVIGLWGHENRRYAAMKFFLYTRAGSLAMLLAFLGLYLAMAPHTFSLPAIAAAQPLAGHATAGGLVLLGLLIGFGVKLPTVPIHNWLPDAHVEAPTEGSVFLAALHLKLGAYGLIAVLLPTIAAAARQWWIALVVLGLVSLVYGAFAALGQRDFKRLVAYTSINHMGYVMLAAGIGAVASDPAVRALALTGAVFQMVSHGLLTGAMFFIAGTLQDQAGTRELTAFGGLGQRAPLFAALLAVAAFGSLGLPGLSGFIAEFQVIGATLSVNLWAALAVILGLIVATGLYLRVVLIVLMRPATSDALHEPAPRRLAVVGVLVALSALIGIAPGLLESVIAATTLTP
ncbi:MAG TPA: NADH-quinone oxidoreductase subunit M [Rhodanobacteraceae bacterium]|nr:NADH-quinone oxidoreductase subunit M [Rhodanobacteraceae bacterium]